MKERASNACGTSRGLIVFATTALIVGWLGLRTSYAQPAAPPLWQRMTRPDGAGSTGDASGAETGERKLGPPPSATAYERNMWYGDWYATRAGDAGPEYRITRRRLSLLLDKAVLGYERAIEAAPDRAEPHLRLAELLYAHKLARAPARYTSREQKRLRAAVLSHWATFEKLAPRDPRLRYVLPRRALEYTRLGTKDGYRHAIADYTRYLNESDAVALRGDMGRLASNLAEVHMMAGHMPEAITWYRRALEVRPSPDWAFGLAVAYDRDGQGLRARELLRVYVSRSTVQTFVKNLSPGGGTFFVPPSEVYYYYALLHEALGSYDLAIESYRKFIRAGVHSQFQARARWNINHLKRLMKKPPTDLGRPANGHRSDWRRKWHLKWQP